jgi:hypothetical protein
MFGKLGDIAGLMKQAKQMQDRVKQLQEEAAKRTYEAEAGGGAVRVTVNGKADLIAIKIQPDAVSADDIESLEEFIKAAVNAGARKAQEAMKAEMAEITGGLNLPGMGGE